MVTIEDAQNFLTKDFEKYNHPGIYAIYIDKKLVYIGKSRNMAIRVVSHVNEIESNKKSNKYIQLYRAKQAGHEIRFDVIEILDQDDELLSREEAKLIRQYFPCLNTQIPLIDNPRFFEYNKRAKKIKFEEILYGRMENSQRSSQL